MYMNKYASILEQYLKWESLKTELNKLVGHLVSLILLMESKVLQALGNCIVYQTGTRYQKEVKHLIYLIHYFFSVQYTA